MPDSTVLRLRCRTGHAWSAESLVARQDTDVEDALWIALRVLEERAESSRRMADLATAAGRGWIAGASPRPVRGRRPLGGAAALDAGGDAEQPTLPANATGP